MERLHIMPDMFTSLSHIIFKNKNLYGTLVVKLPANAGAWVQSLAQEDSACSEKLSLWTAPGVACAPRAGALQQQNRHEEQPPSPRPESRGGGGGAAAKTQCR